MPHLKLENLLHLTNLVQKAFTSLPKETRAHCQRVAAYTDILVRNAIKMRFYVPEHPSDDLIHHVGKAVAWHDIGKSLVPKHILGKLGKFSEDEMSIMRKHTQVALTIFQEDHELKKQTALYDMAFAVALCHHERWDGKGYPQGIKGEEIPFIARACSIADAFDAMTNDRHYRKALPYDQVLREIREGAGTQFDPLLVEAFEPFMKEFNAPRRDIELIFNTIEEGTQ